MTWVCGGTARWAGWSRECGRGRRWARSCARFRFGHAALRSRDLREVLAADQTAVLRLWARRYRDLGSAPGRNWCAGCTRCHASWCPVVSSRRSRLNYPIHMAAVTQIRYPGTTGRNYYDRRVAEGMAHKSALCAPKRRISDALYAQTIAEQRRTTPRQ
jgi:hypothetical protein